MHTKTQLTHARIKCTLKDSNSDTPLSKVFKLSILASTAISISTKVTKCLHTMNYSIFTQNGTQFKALESISMLTIKKMNTMHE